MNPVISGFSLILLSGIAGGVFAVPLRRRRTFSIELMWMMAFLLGYLLIPHVIAILFLPGWETALQRVGLHGLAPAIGCGLGWGVASLLFAHAITMMGVSLGSAIIMGIATATGSALPLVRRWAALPLEACLTVLAGIGLCLVGVAICGHAGVIRERATVQTQARRLGLGLTLCVLSGLLSACANLGFEFGAPVAQAFGPGNHPALASLGRWLPVYWGGGFVVVLFSIIKITHQRGWKNLTAAGSSHDMLWTLVVGLFLTLGQLPYGIGAHLLGALGTSVGWALYLSASILVANLMGLWTGEWRQAPPAARRWLWGGLITLVTAMAVLATKTG